MQPIESAAFSDLDDAAPADRFDVAIIGAGPVGGALACRLAASGRRVLLVDRAALPPMAHPDFDGRAYAIAAGSQTLLEAGGLWRQLPYAPCPILDIAVTDGKPGYPASPLRLHFDHREVGEAPFGWIIEARALRIAINRRVDAEKNIQLLAPARLALARQPGRVTLQAADGRRFNARLAVAADGRGSRLRAAAGIPVTAIAYRQAAMVCAIAHAAPHEGVALEHFLPGGPFARLPMSGSAETPHRSAIVFTDRPEVVARLNLLDEARFGRELARRLGPELGPIRPIGRRWTYPLSAMHAARYTATRLALVGDAAHGIHPIAGQGLNLGLRDAAALATLIDSASDPGAPELLAAYQAARRPANLAMLAATDALDRLFSTNNPAIRLARDLGLAGVNRMPRLKQRFMRAAMGI